MVKNIIEATQNNDIKNVLKLIKKGVNIDEYDQWGMNALLYASHTCNYEIAKCLIDNNANVNLTTSSGSTPVLFASAQGSNDIVQYLIDNNADINIKDEWGCTPLIKATQNKHMDIISFLVENKADVNAVDKIEGQTALMYAAREDDCTTVQYLIDNGADVNIGDQFGLTAAMLAASRDKRKAVELLLPITYMSVTNIIRLKNLGFEEETQTLIPKLMKQRDLDRYFTFCELFNIGTYANNNNNNNNMIGYTPPLNDDECRPYPSMFISNHKNALFEPRLVGEIFEFATDIIK